MIWKHSLHFRSELLLSCHIVQPDRRIRFVAGRTPSGNSNSPPSFLLVLNLQTQSHCHIELTPHVCMWYFCVSTGAWLPQCTWRSDDRPISLSLPSTLLETGKFIVGLRDARLAGPLTTIDSSLSSSHLTAGWQDYTCTRACPVFKCFEDSN